MLFRQLAAAAAHRHQKARLPLVSSIQYRWPVQLIYITAQSADLIRNKPRLRAADPGGACVRGGDWPDVCGRNWAGEAEPELDGDG